MAGEQVLREAVELASPSLSTALRSWESGRPVQPPAVRKAMVGLRRYQLRMSSRATPFGLMAGVARAGFGGTSLFVAGSSHVKAARPDHAWLRAVAAGLEERCEVLVALRLTANDLCTLRAGRVTLLQGTGRPGAAADRGGGVEVSIRATAVVRRVLEALAVCRLGGDLVAMLREDFPSVLLPDIQGVLVEMVRQGFVITELVPPLTSADPLGRMINVLERVEAASADSQALRAVRAELAHYAGTAMGKGSEDLLQAGARMQGLAAVPHPVQVDLGLDVTARLPHDVAREAEYAARTLHRLAPTVVPRHVSEYHTRFLERYGSGIGVPVREVVDPARGLGPLGPVATEDPSSRQGAGEARQRLLAGLAQSAVLEGRHEVVLDAGLVEQLAGEQRDPGPSPSVDICAHVLANSSAELDAGDFRLMLTAGMVAPLAGAMRGRFSHLLDAGSDMRASLAAVACGEAGAQRVVLDYRPSPPRHANVACTSGWGLPRLCVGTFREEGDLGVEDLLVEADEQGLYVRSRALGTRVVPSSFHMLNPERQHPLVRFLATLGALDNKQWAPWDWGPAAVLPYLPRVRHGRTILSPARWTLDAQSLPGTGGSFDRWREGFEQWRRTYRVPAAVRATHYDQFLELDLDDEEHLHLLHQDLVRGRVTALSESPHATGYGFGWTTDAASKAHRPFRETPAEFVFHLTSGPRHNPKPAPATPVLQARRIRHLPGGLWLYGRLECPEAFQNDVLLDHVPALLADAPEGADQWFYIRYADPRPHLRLRLRTTTQQAHMDMLTALRRWAGELQEGGLVGDFSLETYEPETQRYGGADGIEAAEEVFCLDSHAALLELRLLREMQLDPDLLAAASLTDLLTGALGVHESEAWLMDSIPKQLQRGFFTSHRQQALALITSDSLPAPLGDELARSWQARAAAAARHMRALEHLPRERRDQSLSGLLHMHHNRLIGPDRDSEERCFAVARGMAEARHNRRKHMP
ncbi:lantibiotic dehydratase [Streptomyces sp. NPDC093097]|uniref:lantibiotic dehydratase n=1 Tax=Streptomyces sp. NPDC093097 TaxID=3366027 RepID=UPI0037F10FA8